MTRVCLLFVCLRLSWQTLAHRKTDRQKNERMPTCVSWRKDGQLGLYSPLTSKQRKTFSDQWIEHSEGKNYPHKQTFGISIDKQTNKQTNKRLASALKNEKLFCHDHAAHYFLAKSFSEAAGKNGKIWIKYFVKKVF